MDVWKALDQDVTALAQEVAELCRNSNNTTGKSEKAGSTNYVTNPSSELNRQPQSRHSPSNPNNHNTIPKSIVTA
ncbi:hypothetical protein X975_13443, partial [Stegodyphus mimosarum]